jgi:hypothetical protein
MLRSRSRPRPGRLLGRWGEGGEVGVRRPGAAPCPRPTRPPAPGTCCARRRAVPRPAGGTRSRVSAALRGRGLLPFEWSRALRDASFVVGLLLPASPPPPLPACICWTPASSGHRRRVPRAREGEAAPCGAALGGALLPGEAARSHRALSAPAARRTTPPLPRKTAKAGCLARTASSIQPAAVEPDPLVASTPERRAGDGSCDPVPLGSASSSCPRILPTFRALVPFPSLSHPGVLG